MSARQGGQIWGEGEGGERKVCGESLTDLKPETRQLKKKKKAQTVCSRFAIGSEVSNSDQTPPPPTHTHKNGAGRGVCLIRWRIESQWSGHSLRRERNKHNRQCGLTEDGEPRELEKPTDSRASGSRPASVTGDRCHNATLEATKLCPANCTVCCRRKSVWSCKRARTCYRCQVSGDVTAVKSVVMLLLPSQRRCYRCQISGDVAALKSVAMLPLWSQWPCYRCQASGDVTDTDSYRLWVA